MKNRALSVVLLIIAVFASASFIYGLHGASPYSYLNLKEKIILTELALEQTQSLNRDIRNSEAELAVLQEKSRTLTERYGTYISKIYSPTKGFHFPSLLILLEQRAYGHNLDLAVRLTASGDIPQGAPEEQAPAPGQNVHPAAPMAPVITGAAPGVNTTEVSLTIDGSYESAMGYLEFLEQEPFMEPVSFVIRSSGEGVTADIALRVYGPAIKP